MAMVARKERVIELAVKSMGNAGPGMPRNYCRKLLAE